MKKFSLLEETQLVKQLWKVIVVMVGLVTTANFAVRFEIVSQLFLTYSVLIFPLTYLLSNWLIVTKSQKAAFTTVLVSVPFAAVTSYLVNYGASNAFLISFGSVSAFFVSHLVNITVFVKLYEVEKLKKLAPFYAPVLALSVDHVVFYSCAFLFETSDWWKIALSDWLAKSVFAVVATCFIRKFYKEKFDV